MSNSPGRNTDLIKRVLVIYVGGTIGMKRNTEGVLRPAHSVFLNELRSSRLHDPDVANKYFPGVLQKNQLVIRPSNKRIIQYELKEYEVLLDSSEMSVKDWIRIAKNIQDEYNKFDGFVLLQGTDTLAYTASALSFLLEGLAKPVIVTGAQLRTDAEDHILTSVIFAGSYSIPEVCCYFGGALMRGNRTKKYSTKNKAGFHSPNYLHLATVDAEIVVHENLLLPLPEIDFKAHAQMESDVVVVKIFPTITARLLKKFLKPPVKGVVIESYGSGNIPTSDELIEVIKSAIRQNVIIVNVSQCSHGPVDAIYAGGALLEKMGVVMGGDTSVEAAFTKLCFVLALPDKTDAEKVEIQLSNERFLVIYNDFAQEIKTAANWIDGKFKN